MRNRSTPAVLPQSPTSVTVIAGEGYRRHGFLRGLLVLLLSGPVGLILYMRGSGAVSAVIGGIVVTALILLAASQIL